MELVGLALLIGHGVGEKSFEVSRELLRDSEKVVVAADGGLYLDNGKMRKVAESLLASTAEVVAVGESVATLGFGVDETADASCLMAAIAKQDALEVVVQDNMYIFSYLKTDAEGCNFFGYRLPLCDKY